MNRLPPNLIRRRPRGALGWVLWLVLLAALGYLAKRPGQPTPTRTSTPSSSSPPRSNTEVSSSPAGDSDFAELEREHRQRVPVTGSGTVMKVLPDDTEGDRHQRFLIRLQGNQKTGGGGSILIAHNIDLAERVPVREGDSIRFAGEYIWNDRGGVVHWTHRDPAHKHHDGYLERDGRRYE